MNWEAIGAIGEIAGALAVVASLIYLATQIRQSNKLLNLESRKYVIEQVTMIGEIVLKDESLVELMLKPREDLNNVENARLMILGRRMIIGIQQGFDHAPDKDDLEGLATVMKALYHRVGINYGVPDVWPEYRNVLSINAPDFANWFDEKIATK